MFRDYFGMDFCFFLNCFFIYSFLGYIFECIVLSLQTRKLVLNRGFAHCPLCIIYGVGAFGVQYVIAPAAHGYLQLFIIGAVSATLLEIITAGVMTRLFGSFWWDYRSRPFNYHGVICLESTICWGVMAVALVAFLHPVVVHIVDIYYIHYGKWLGMAAMLCYGVDFTYCFYKALGRHRHGKDIRYEEAVFREELFKEEGVFEEDIFEEKV